MCIALGEPGDVADVVVFLASDAARWITGRVIDASGGLFLGLRTTAESAETPVSR